MRKELQGKIEAALGVVPLAMTPLSGGCIGEVYRADFSGDTPAVVVKTAGLGKIAALSVEGEMLMYLAQHSPLPVPKVLYNSDELLLMEWLPGDSRFDARTQEHAAELLATLHQVSAPKYGFECDTLIGGLHQPNSQTNSWLEFFCQHRIWHMAERAFSEGQLSRNLLGRLEVFCERAENWLAEPVAPALLHGDAWTTNILAQDGRITGFIDPAIYYGHPEIELAFTTLFGTFDEPFFRRYHEINPIEPGFFELRKDLYNLYPLLVHVRLFGNSYASGIERTLKRIGL